MGAATAAAAAAAAAARAADERRRPQEPLRGAPARGPGGPPRVARLHLPAARGVELRGEVPHPPGLRRASRWARRGGLRGQPGQLRERCALRPRAGGRRVRLCGERAEHRAQRRAGRGAELRDGRGGHRGGPGGAAGGGGVLPVPGVREVGGRAGPAGGRHRSGDPGPAVGALAGGRGCTGGLAERSLQRERAPLAARFSARRALALDVGGPPRGLHEPLQAA